MFWFSFTEENGVWRTLGTQQTARNGSSVSETPKHPSSEWSKQPTQAASLIPSPNNSDPLWNTWLSPGRFTKVKHLSLSGCSGLSSYCYQHGNSKDAQASRGKHLQVKSWKMYLKMLCFPTQILIRQELIHNHIINAEWTQCKNIWITKRNCL